MLSGLEWCDPLQSPKLPLNTGNVLSFKDEDTEVPEVSWFVPHIQKNEKKRELGDGSAGKGSSKREEYSTNF